LLLKVYGALPSECTMYLHSKMDIYLKHCLTSSLLENWPRKSAFCMYGLLSNFLINCIHRYKEVIVCSKLWVRAIVPFFQLQLGTTQQCRSPKCRKSKCRKNIETSSSSEVGESSDVNSLKSKIWTSTFCRWSAFCTLTK
jgi:hypothetical protein